MRRREPVRRDERPEAPLWIRQWNFGRHHFAERGEPGQLDGPVRARFRRAQDEWCVEKGCHRPGKSCAEVCRHSRMERPCGAMERLGH